MPKRVSVTSLQASSLNIINTIRANASPEYQHLVPKIEKTTDIPKVGEVLYGYPAMANQFITALVNRIAAVRVKSAEFNNAYANLKKGMLEFGETVEEVFVSITKAREFSAEKAEAREFKRTLPDVKAAFHLMNYRVQYPITIQMEDLRTAFTSADGVTDMIAKIINAVTTAAEYDEFLLFKYLIIKAVSHGKAHVRTITKGDYNSAASAFRGTSNKMTFMSDKYNEAKVHTVTPRDSQCIFMDADFNASFDVNALASAFNMDKANFMGRLYLIDDFTTFDNDRFSEIRKNSDMIEEVTAAELKAMGGVKAILVDSEWFQIYDKLNNFTEDQVAAGLYWNYFNNVWKIVSHSPFSNIVAFTDGAAPTLPPKITTSITTVSKSADGTTYTLTPAENVIMTPSDYNFIQTQALVEKKIAVEPYGAYIVPNDASFTTTALELMVSGTKYTATTGGSVVVGTEIQFSKAE